MTKATNGGAGSNEGQPVHCSWMLRPLCGRRRSVATGSAAITWLSSRVMRSMAAEPIEAKTELKGVGIREL